jgi:arabinogalactan endo-1,4-beta-galactosidase
VYSRRRLLSAMSLLAATPIIGPGEPAVPSAGRALSVRGADISSLLKEEAAGRTFEDKGRIAPVERLLSACGANVVRLRVWVNPPPGDSDLASALGLARRAHAAGMQVLLDLHYSDSWADKDNQTTPTAWSGQDLSTLVATVRAYTRDTVRAFAAQGTPPAMIQIGNEVTNGMLWPGGRVYDEQGGEHWDGFVALLKAGLQGAADVTSAPPRTLIHIDRGGDIGGARYFYDHILGADVRFDVVALSYYPFWHGPLATLRAQLADLATRYGKDVVVVETAYPWLLPSGDGRQYYVTRADQLPDSALFPATSQGQGAYFEALRTAVRQVPGRRGLGFLAWEPAWLPGVDRDGGSEGDPYGNLTMFDWNGAGLPSLAAFRPVSVPRR